MKTEPPVETATLGGFEAELDAPTSSLRSVTPRVSRRTLHRRGPHPRDGRRGGRRSHGRERAGSATNGRGGDKADRRGRHDSHERGAWPVTAHRLREIVPRTAIGRRRRQGRGDQDDRRLDPREGEAPRLPRRSPAGGDVLPIERVRNPKRRVARRISHSSSGRSPQLARRRAFGSLSPWLPIREPPAMWMRRAWINENLRRHPPCPPRGR